MNFAEIEDSRRVCYLARHFLIVSRNYRALILPLVFEPSLPLWHKTSHKDIFDGLVEDSI